MWHGYLFHQFLRQQIFHKLSQVFLYHDLVEEGDSAVHQPDDGGSAVSSQLVSQAALVAQVHNTNAHTCTSDDQNRQLSSESLQSRQSNHFYIKVNLQMQTEHYVNKSCRTKSANS